MLSIKLLVVDTDGVLTNGTYQISDTGTITKTFYTRDFWALEQLQKQGVHVLIISSNNDECIVRQVARLPERCKTKLCVVTNIENKKQYMDRVLHDMNLDWPDVAYMGDAENDLACVENASFSCCPKNAVSSIRNAVDFVSEYKGGEGCVYDFAMEILKLGQETEK